MIPVTQSEICKEGLYFIRCKNRPDYFLCHEEPSMLVFRKSGYSKRTIVIEEEHIDKAIEDLKEFSLPIPIWIEIEELESCGKLIMEMIFSLSTDFEKVKTVDVLLYG